MFERIAKSNGRTFRRSRFGETDDQANKGSDLEQRDEHDETSHLVVNSSTAAPKKVVKHCVEIKLCYLLFDCYKELYEKTMDGSKNEAIPPSSHCNHDKLVRQHVRL